MPQIWMTYTELAALLDCSVQSARAYSFALDRKKSRDGMTRAKLNVELTARFIGRIREADPMLDNAVQDLLHVQAEMAQRSSARRAARW
jgi:hypothetical protein